MTDRIEYIRYEGTKELSRVMELEPLTRKTFADAADILVTDGLANGVFINNDQYGCGYCTAGALMKAQGVPTKDNKFFHGASEWCDYAAHHPLMKKFMKLITGRSAASMGPVFNWSDENDAETVIKTLREFASQDD